ncbi:MAG: tRNA (adenosine(37)-N6)-threonylcarbamoyltransferase complex dimerization subunit type 1 TsaB [Chitinophagales bacterium]|nr:tRNA (adenosine(37)-N6)-threonylcarbamoyltransferase complex dimerization subunit type 1 TsaB [Chitinophagales bacterium]
MAYLLHIETSSNCCSVALSKDADLIGVLEEVQPNTHAASLPLFIQQLLAENKLSSVDIAAVAVSIGPGSYTGLRVGLSLAKGFCMVNSIPLITISSLRMMAQGLKELYPSYIGDFVPLVDARRMEVYTAQYDKNVSEIKCEYAYVVQEEAWSESATQYLFAGSGAAKVQQFLGTRPNHQFDLSNNVNSARFLCKLAFEKFAKSDFSDLAYAEPLYLKEFGQN